MNEEMATEIVGNLYDTIRKMNVPNETEMSERVKHYVTIQKMQMELEKQKEQLYLELNENEKQEASDLLRKTVEFPQYIPVREVAEILEVTPQMVRRYCTEGKIDAKQRMEGSGKWLIPTNQFIAHHNWNKYIQKKNKINNQSVNIANKIMQYLDEDVE